MSKARLQSPIGYAASSLYCFEKERARSDVSGSPRESCRGTGHMSLVNQTPASACAGGLSSPRQDQAQRQDIATPAVCNSPDLSCSSHALPRVPASADTTSRNSPWARSCVCINSYNRRHFHSILPSREATTMKLYKLIIYTQTKDKGTPSV